MIPSQPQLTQAAAERLLRRAKVSLLQTDPFFACILMHLQAKPADADKVPIMATDGQSLLYSPEAVLALKWDELRGVLAHETLHVALEHHLRLAGKDLSIGNRAADYVVNQVLVDSGFTLPEGALLDPRFKGWTFEQVYAYLEKNRSAGGGGGSQQQQQQSSGGQSSAARGQQQQQQQQQQSPSASPASQPQNQLQNQPEAFGQVLPYPGDKPEQEKERVRIAREIASNAARTAGRLPGGLARMVEEMRRAELDWRVILRQFLADNVPVDFTWSRPNKRLLSQDIYLPGVRKEGLRTIAFVIDTSGSIDKQTLDAMCAEISECHRELKPDSLLVVYCDADVQYVQDFGPTDELKFEPKGGGGTDFRPAFAFLEALPEPPRCAIYLTDMEGKFPSEPPAFPVLWVCTTNKVAPFGETVYLRN